MNFPNKVKVHQLLAMTTSKSPLEGIATLMATVVLLSEIHHLSSEQVMNEARRLMDEAEQQLAQMEEFTAAEFNKAMNSPSMN